MGVRQRFIFHQTTLQSHPFLYRPEPISMSEVELNKKYIREQIPEAQQSSFYEYFVKLPDQHLFHQWTLSRTVEAVQHFQELIREPTCPENQPGTNLKKLEVGTTMALTDQPNCPEQLTSTPVASNSNGDQKKQNALTLLEEIERNFNDPAHKQKREIPDNWQNGQIRKMWMTGGAFPVKKDKVQQKEGKDPFEDFDSCIDFSPKKVKTQVVRIQESSSVKLPSKHVQVYEMQRSQQIRKQPSAELKRIKSDRKLEVSNKLQKPLNGPTPDKIFKHKLWDQFPCRKLEVTEEIKSIAVQNHQIVHRTLLPDYAIYHIKAHPGNVLCKRTYDDFLELSKILEKLYPGVKVPSIESGSWFSESDIALINTNKITLQQFLNDILHHPTLSKTPLFKDFITIPDHKAIEKAFGEYARISANSSFSQLTNENGFVSITLSEEQHKVIEQLPKWKKYFSNYLQKNIDLISTLISQYESIKLTFSQLMSLHSDFNHKIKQMQECRVILKNPEELEMQLTRQSNYFGKRRNQLEKDIMNMKEKYLTILKYEKLNVVSFEPFIDTVESLTERYIKRLENEPESPSSDLQSFQITGRTSRFEDDIWEESPNIAVFKYQVGYFNSKLLQESQLFNSRLIDNLQLAWSSVFDKRQLAEQRLSH